MRNEAVHSAHPTCPPATMQTGHQTHGIQIPPPIHANPGPLCMRRSGRCLRQNPESMIRKGWLGISWDYMGVNGKLNRNGTDLPHPASDPVKINEPLINRSKMKIIVKKSRLLPVSMSRSRLCPPLLSLFSVRFQGLLKGFVGRAPLKTLSAHPLTYKHIFISFDKVGNEFLCAIRNHSVGSGGLG